jgi:hypothetical protein
MAMVVKGIIPTNEPFMVKFGWKIAAACRPLQSAAASHERLQRYELGHSQ